jgi:acyl-coenzyme A thioesterase PaaI-like protein
MPTNNANNDLPPTVAKPNEGKAQGFLAKRPPSARLLRWIFNFWPTYRFAGVRVKSIATDFTAATVELRLGLLNRNYVGTAFGGTLYAMTDPFYMLMMLRQLGSGYIVWDKAGAIRYLKPGKGVISAHFSLSKGEVERVRSAVEAAGKLDLVYTVQLHDAAGQLVAEVEKTLYVRKMR